MWTPGVDDDFTLLHQRRIERAIEATTADLLRSLGVGPKAERQPNPAPASEPPKRSDGPFDAVYRALDRALERMW